MRGQSRKTLARRHNAVLIAVMAVATPLIATFAITQPEMRRVALVHSIYAFVFGIAITATSINLVMSLGS